MTYHLCVLVGKPIPRVLVGKGPERIVCVLKLQEGTAVLGWNAAERRGGGHNSLLFVRVVENRGENPKNWGPSNPRGSKYLLRR